MASSLDEVKTCELSLFKLDTLYSSVIRMYLKYTVSLIRLPYLSNICNRFVTVDKQ